MPKLFNVEEKDSGKRIDLFILEKDATLTRTSAKKLIMEGLINADGQVVRPNFRVRPGNVVEYKQSESKKFIDSSDLTEIVATKMPIDVIYEDSNIILVNKPAGLVIHPVYNHKDDTLLNGLTFYFQQKKEQVKVRPVHRLDKETSGVILFTKNKDSNEFYSKLFENHNIEKTYYAVVKGDFADFMQRKNRPDMFEYFTYISKEKTVNKAYMNTSKEMGLPARTKFFFSRYFEHAHDDRVYSLVKVMPLTGRTHQIRVHLSSLGFPILGDLIYSKTTYKRMMLHAYSLKIPVVTSKGQEERVFVAELPKEFR